MTKPSAVFWRWTREQQLQRVHPLKEDTADVIKFKVGWNSIIVINMIAAEVVGGAGSKITKAPKFRRHCSIKISCTRTSDPSLSVFQSVGRSDRREIIFFDWQLQTYFLQRGWWVGGGRLSCCHFLPILLLQSATFLCVHHTCACGSSKAYTPSMGSCCCWCWWLAISLLKTYLLRLSLIRSD